MSFIMEEDERPPHANGSETPATSHVEGERMSGESFSRRTSSHDVPTEQTNGHAGDDNHYERPLEDSGGGGDTEGGGEAEGGSGGMGEEKEKDQSATSHEEKRSITEEDIKSNFESIVTVSKVSSSKRSISNRSRGGGEGSIENGSQQTVKEEDLDKMSSSESMSSGFLIATQILEELIDSIMKIKGVDVIEKGSQKEEGSVKQSSIMTIKSADERGSIVIDEELQAQLALEQETAAQEREKKFQENVALYHSLIASKAHLKHKNVFLLKQMFEYYKRKKIEHLFKEMPLANVDMEGKYVRALLAYEAAQKDAVEEEAKMNRQVSALEENKKVVESELEEEWNNLINREREVSKGLVITQSTGHNSDKQSVESLIQRRIAKSKEVTKQRLIYFKLRDIAAADESHLKSLENLGDDLTLMEYEQLKMQSQSCVEKLEERDVDLLRLRSKATTAIQVLAEIREKTRTLQEEIESGKVTLHDVNQQLNQTRERVGCEKKRRDMSRSDTVRLRQEAGLLSEPKLLQDYKESLLEKENLLARLQEGRSKFESQKQNILSLRRELAALQQKDDRDE